MLPPLLFKKLLIILYIIMVKNDIKICARDTFRLSFSDKWELVLTPSLLLEALESGEIV